MPFIIIVPTIILSAIYALIRSYLNFARRNDTNVDNIGQDRGGSFAINIAKYLDEKRKKSKCFHTLYYISFGIILVLVFVGAVLSINWIRLFLLDTDSILRKSEVGSKGIRERKYPYEASRQDSLDMSFSRSNGGTGVCFISQ